MINLQQKFTRPNTTVKFFEAENHMEIGAVISNLKAGGAIIDIMETTSPTGLVFTRTVMIPDQVAFDTVLNNPTLAANKTARAAYNTEKGITVAVTKTIV